MRPFVLLALLACAAAGAQAYCLRNSTPSATVHAEVVPTQARRPPKLFSESVGPGREFCCNPKNADCNPDGSDDQGRAAFQARVEAGPGVAAAIACGEPTTDTRFPSHARIAAPVRGALRAVANPRYDAHRPANPDNPSFFVEAVTADNRVVATYSCPPRALSGTPHS
jgi:hypothetical protein